MLQIIPLPAFKDNYIWLLQAKDSNDCVIVDPGTAEPVLNYLLASKLKLSAILLTHHHADHCGGVEKLLEYFTVPVYGPAKESISTITHALLSDNKLTIQPLQCEFQVIEVPGHTLGHLAYYGHGILFCGDTLFMAGCGRLFEGTAEQMYVSLTTLVNLPDATLVYCAHEYTLANLAFAQVVEPDNFAVVNRLEQVRLIREAGKPTVPASIQLEKATNPFLRCHLPTVKQAAEKFAGKSLVNSVEVFRTIREWKDTFKVSL